MRKFSFACSCRFGPLESLIGRYVPAINLLAETLLLAEIKSLPIPICVEFLTKEFNTRRDQIIREERRRRRGREGELGPWNPLSEMVNISYSRRPPYLSLSMAYYPDRSAPPSFQVTFTDEESLPSVDTLKDVMIILEAESAYLLEDNNHNYQLHSRDRYQSLASYGKGDAHPTVIDWITQLRPTSIDNLGGTAHVLKSPCYRVEPFLNGILIQLTKEYFDPQNPEHLAVQRRVMEHLGIWDYPPLRVFIDPPLPLHLQIPPLQRLLGGHVNSFEEVKNMSIEEQQVLYDQLQAAKQAKGIE